MLLYERVVHIQLVIYVFITITGSLRLLVTEGTIRLVVSASVLTWFIRYIYLRNLQFINNLND
jgi:hypothetical protein